jgi:peptidylprolyl isomerase
MEPTNTENTPVAAETPTEVKAPEVKKPIDIKAMAILIIGVLVIGVVIFMALGNTGSGQAQNQSTNQTQNQSKKVLLETNMGNITLELYSDMPITASNFEKLVKQGFYDGVIFHRVISGFMLQGGDPTGTGMGGPGYNIMDEFTDHNRNDRGTISMANAGPNTGGSQFFINLVNNSPLNSKHPVFGKVIEGMDVVDKIGKTRTDSNDRPVSEVKIISAKVI